MHKYFKTAFCVAALFAAALSPMPALAGEAGVGQFDGEDFAFKMFARLARPAAFNVVVSPFSAYQAMCMTANGAAGNTRAQMLNALGITPGAITAVNHRNYEALNLLNGQGDVQMLVANAVFADGQSAIKPSFVQLCHQSYFAEAYSKPFGAATVDFINHWCSEKTHGKITKIVESLNSADQIMIFNAVYFKGAWERAFSPNATMAANFTNLAGDKKQVQMMSTRQGLAYMHSGGMQAVFLPYAGQNQRLYIFLPPPNSDFNQFVARFTRKNWNSWIEQFSPTEVILELPRFKLNYVAELDGALEALGIKDAFSKAADFQNMVTRGPHTLGHVVHKVFMEVNEEGTEAAAVTGGAPKGLEFSTPPVPRMTVDHPFIVVLTDNRTHEILFMGSIVDP